MPPAPSIIAFTTLSGLGFGLMIWLGLAPPSSTPWVMATFGALALGLAAIGLMASTLHLGHPERAIKAFSQWRSSWLSREGVAAVATLAVFTLWIGLWVLTGERMVLLGYLAAVLAAATIYCTAMIYAQLKTVPRWNSPWTPILFFGYALTGGALLAAKEAPVLILLGVLGLLQLVAWWQTDPAFAQAKSTMNSATGLKGDVRLLEAPHTGQNYLLTEMVFKIGRKHAQKLRGIALALAAALPLVLGLTLGFHHSTAVPIVLSHLVGTLVARWLFFAEAEHVVGLYYGAR